MNNRYTFRSSRSIAERQSLLAFTQLEILVGMGILATLAALCMGICSSAMSKIAMVREISAGRTLIAAYKLYAGDNNGNYLRGYDENGPTVWYAPLNKNVSGVVTKRYPYRLAPYFNYQMDGVIFVNNNGKEIENQNPRGSFMYDYMVSLCPGLGLNYLFAGGYWAPGVNEGMQLQYPSDCVATQGASDRSILVFASSAYTAPGGMEKIDGFHIIAAPNSPAMANLETVPWSSGIWKKDANPRSYGFVDARYDGKAVCVFLDGSVSTHTIEELRDMRLWSRNACAQNNPNYSPQL